MVEVQLHDVKYVDGMIMVDSSYTNVSMWRFHYGQKYITYFL